MPCVWLAPEQLAAMRAEAAENAPLETGGMLLGYSSPGFDSHLVAQVVAGGPKAVRTEYSFRPDGIWQQALLEAAYFASGRIIGFIGDWHSHPRGAVGPSWRDRLTAIRVALSPHARAPRPLSIIVASGNPLWSVGAWTWRGVRFERCEIREL